MRLRWLLFAATVTLVVVPAYALATQIVLPGVTDQVVEGHTVYALIEKASFANVTLEAAAVAFLVREQRSLRDTFKGVLWFNDQYLVSPENGGSSRMRHPCGGAVIAVNQGDPDPRTLRDSSKFAPAPPGPVPAGAGTFTVENPDPGWGDFPVAMPGHGVAPDPFGPDAGAAGTNLTTQYDYIESYFFTDPNDARWTVDKYVANVTVSYPVNGTGPLWPYNSTFPLWVVNMGGGTGFSRDNGRSNCGPRTDDPHGQNGDQKRFSDRDRQICNTTTGGALGPVLPDSCPSSPPGIGQDPDGDGVPIDGWDAKPRSLGYYEPSDPATNGGATYCYDGNAPQGNNVGRYPGTGCNHSNSQNKLRQYNAVLYFLLGPDDVRVTISNLAHGDDDTNGCESTLFYDDGFPKDQTEWMCPDVDGDGVPDDDAEGNSHPFNPPGYYVPTLFDPVTGAQVLPPDSLYPNSPGTGQYYDWWSYNRECSLGYDDYSDTPLQLGQPPRSTCNPGEHATHNRGHVSLYFSGDWRPDTPAVRAYRVFDEEGEEDQFHENNQPQARDHPGQKDFDLWPNYYTAYRTNPYRDPASP